MTDRDDKLAGLYRALAKEEPPESLDAAILAAARREAMRPSLTRRWAVPVSLAAVLVLAIGVTLEMRDQSPGIEAPTASPPVRSIAPESPTVREEKEAPPSTTTRAPKPKPMPKREEPQFVPSPRVTPSPEPSARGANIAPAPVQPATRASAAPAAPSAEKRIVRPQAAPAASDLAGAVARVPADNPGAALESIAKLRAAGRDEEADRALEEFRRRFPDYRMDDATWARVKPR